MGRFLLTAILALGLQVSAANAASKDCKDEAADAVAELNITGVLVATQANKCQEKGSLICSYRHWFRTPLCEKGYVVVLNNRGCHTVDVYTQSGCSIEGLKEWW